MADSTSDKKLISSTNSGFPAYLDFTKMRSDSIDYLGNLTGKIWTDYNLHDPGITILEMLIYAILDLGYRTNFPVADILTRNPTDTSTDNNFFTPALILANNPLTITDYRKLLVDLEGIKNAWLEIDKEETNVCEFRQGVGEGQYLNGLYHVYIELEDEFEKPVDPKGDTSKYEEALDRIKKSLMSHRNLCEDFEDIFILCKLEVGVCADIELEQGADAVAVYKTIVEKLQAFFSPEPKFYKLQELLDKSLPIEKIFAGRPYNLSESHGFVDPDEFEQIKLRKEIHLSDVYKTLLAIDGVKAVRRLRLQKCTGGRKNAFTEWKLQMPENTVPVFSIDCSGFQFVRNGNPVVVDFKKVNPYFNLAASANAKLLMAQAASLR